MLRESMHIKGQEINVRGVTQGFDADITIPHAALLVAFAEAVVSRNAAAITAARVPLHAALGDAGLVDAAAVAAAFHGFVRIADAIGIPYDTAAQGRDVPELREETGINDFYRVRGER